MIREILAPTMIAEGTRLRGTVAFFSATYIFGLVDGNLDHQSAEPLQIGRTGWINGNIVALGTVIIEGRVDGDIRSSSKVRLLPTANVRGLILAPAVEIQAGAMFNGELKPLSPNKATAPPGPLLVAA